MPSPSQGRLTSHVEAPTMWMRLSWLVLSFVPSSLMLGVTTHVSTDVAPVPLLWVLPLAMYLGTFVLAFSSREWIAQRWLTRVLPLLVYWMHPHDPDERALRGG